MSVVAATNIRPLADRVLERPQLVLAVGTGRHLESGQCQTLDVKPGDIIMFSRYAGTELKVEGEELLLISDRDILAAVEG